MASSSPSHCLSKYFFSCLAIIVIALSAPSPSVAASCKVLVIKSGELKPYQDVLRGLRESCDCTVQELPLRDEEVQEKILEKSPNIVVAIGTKAFKQVRSIDSVPVIYAMTMPSEVDAFKKPNISGVSIDIAPVNYITTIRKLFPGVKRIGVLFDPRNTAPFVQEAAKAAHGAGIELVTREVRDSSRIASALNEMRGGIDLLWMLPDATVVTSENVELLLRFSFEHTVPIFTFSRKYVEMGAAASADMDPYDIGVQAGEMANKLTLLKQGPFREFARTSHVTVNTNVLGKMGLRISRETLEKVEEID